MEIRITCQECQSPLSADGKIEDGVIVMEAELCPACVARSILMSEDAPWVRMKFLKAGHAA